MKYKDIPQSFFNQPLTPESIRQVLDTKLNNNEIQNLINKFRPLIKSWLDIWESEKMVDFSL